MLSTFLIYLNIFVMLSLAGISVTHKQYAIGTVFVSLAMMYSFLKFFDLTGLYPSQLWMTFNLCQGALFFRFVKTTEKNAQALEKVNAKFDKLNNKNKK